MAIIPLEKIHIIVHKSIKDKFLKDLQKEHIVHITELKDTQTSASEELNIVNNALSHLAGYRKRGVLEMFLSMKTPVDYESVEKTNKEYDYQRVTGKIQHIRQTIENNRSSLKKLQDDIEILHPWTPMDISFEELHSMQKASAIAASVPSRDLLEELLKKVQDDIEILHPWTPMDISFEELHSMQKASAIAASVPSRDLLEELLKKV